VHREVNNTQPLFAVKQTLRFIVPGLDVIELLESGVRINIRSIKNNHLFLKFRCSNY